MIANRVIGGNGGETASIFVTGLSETDTVYATKDGKTYVGKWIQHHTETYNDSLIPAMTSNTTPSGVASASSEYSNSTYSQPAWMAFDRTNNSNDGWCSTYGCSLPQWIQYKFEKSVTISGMKLYNPADSGYGKTSNGYVSISTDGVNFNKIYDFSIETSTFDYPVEVDFGQNYETQYVRVYFTSRNNAYGGGSCRAYVLQFMGYETTTVSGHLVDNLKKYGTYTITATDGTNTATQDVLVDMAIQFDVEMTI